MQVCPCVRLRLRRQYGRDWQRQWGKSSALISRGARNMSQAGRSASHPPDAEVAPSAAPPDKHFNEAAYSPQDDKFWTRYQQLWGAAADAVAGQPDSGIARQETHRSPSLHRGAETKQRRVPRLNPTVAATSIPGASKRPRRPNAHQHAKKPRPQGFLGQLGHLRRSCPVADFQRSNAAFWKWKKSLAETWQMLEASDLPHEASQSRVLRQLMEPGDHDNSDSSSRNDVERMKAAWETLTPEKRRDSWPDLMAAALRAHPHRAHQVFTATFDSALVPSYLAEDTIHYLVRQHATPPELTEPPYIPANDLFALLRHVLESSPNDYLRLQQTTLYFYTRTMDTPEAIAELYRLLVAHKHPLHKNTRLQIAGRLASSPAHKMLALEVLQTALKETDLDINTPQGAALCTAILSVGEGNGEGEGEGEGQGQGDSTSTAGAHHPAAETATPAEMFEALLRCGLEPNLITYTTIIRGLCLKRELDAAQQVLQLMVNNKTEPDAYVYSIMMNGAKLCGHYQAIQQVAESAAAQGVRHPFVWTDFLQAIYSTAFAEARSDPEAKRPRVVASFPLMVQAYAKLFELAPLRTLLPDVNRLAVDEGGPTEQSRNYHVDSTHKRWEFSAQLAPTVRALPQLPPTELIEPTSAALTTMVLGYIQGLSNPYDVIAFYSHFRRLLQAGNPTAVRLVRDQGTLVHDVVVMALCEFEGMLRVTLDVVGDMLRDAAAALDGGQEQQQGIGTPQAVKAGQHPPPSVYTWSILLNGFMFHRQVKQGERILHMMRERGVEPNQVTWNTLMAGYARIQNVRKTAGTLQRLERAGFEPNEFTFRAFSYLGDKASVLRYLESRRVAKPQANEAATAATTSTLPTAMATTTVTTANLAKTPRPGHRTRVGHGPRRSGDAGTANELRGLENEVEEIAKMMDEEQRDSTA